MSDTDIPEMTTPEASTELAQLFRHSLRDGRVHPLLHPLRRYREELPR